MGTRRSRHNKGRKPVYKDHGGALCGPEVLAPAEGDKCGGQAEFILRQYNQGKISVEVMRSRLQQTKESLILARPKAERVSLQPPPSVCAKVAVPPKPAGSVVKFEDYSRLGRINGAVSASTETAMGAALKKAKENRAHFLLSKVAQDFRPKDAEKVKPDEAYERFKDIRFGWTGGDVECPQCHSSKTWELRNRMMWRCKVCGHQFSVTSGTIFSARKASFQTILHAVSLRIHSSENILQSSYLLGVNYRTAHAWASKFRLFLGNAPKHRVQDSRWPFLNGDRSEGAKLVALVNGILPRAFPEQKRADIAQEMILGVLSGEITEDGLKAAAAKYIRRYHGGYENHFRDASFDQMRGDGDGYNLHDMISEETATDNWNRFI